MKSRRFAIYHLDLNFFISNRAISVTNTIEKDTNGKEISKTEYHISFSASRMMLAKSVTKKNDHLHEQLSIIHGITPPSYVDKNGTQNVQTTDPKTATKPYQISEQLIREFLFDAIVLNMQAPSSEEVAIPATTIVKRDGQSDVQKSSGYISVKPGELLDEIYKNGFTIKDVPLKDRLFYGYDAKGAEKTDVTMVPFIASASMARTGEYLFVNKAVAAELMKRLSLDLFTINANGDMQATDLIASNKSVIKPAKVAAYLGLALSDINSVSEGLARLQDEGVTQDELQKIEQMLRLDEKKCICVSDIDPFPMNIEQIAPWSWEMHELNEPLVYDDQLPSWPESTTAGASGGTENQQSSQSESTTSGADGGTGSGTISVTITREEITPFITNITEPNDTSIWTGENRALCLKCIKALFYKLLQKQSSDLDYETILPQIPKANEIEDSDSVVFAVAVYMLAAMVSKPSEKKLIFNVQSINNNNAGSKNKGKGKQNVDFKEIEKFVETVFTSKQDADQQQHTTSEQDAGQQQHTTSEQDAGQQQHTQRNTLKKLINQPYMVKLTWDATGKTLTFQLDKTKATFRKYLPLLTPAVELEVEKLLDCLYQAAPPTKGSTKNPADTKPLTDYWTYTNINALKQEHSRTKVLGNRSLYERIKAADKNTPEKSLEQYSIDELTTFATNNADDIIALHRQYKREKKQLFSNLCNASDGSGFASPEFFDALEKILLLPKNRLNAVILRLPWIKGLLVKVDFKKILRQMTGRKEGSELKVTDRYGIQRDLNECQVLLFDSMFKGGSLFNDKALNKTKVEQAGVKPQQGTGKIDYWKFFWQKLNGYGFLPAVAGKNSRPGMKSHLNYQFVSTNGLDQETLISMVKNELSQAIGRYQAPQAFLEHLSNEQTSTEDNTTGDDLSDNGVQTTQSDQQEKQEQEDNGSTSAGGFSENRLMLELLERNPSLATSSYMRTKITKDLQRRLLDLACVHEEVAGDVRLLVGDLDFQLKYIAANHLVRQDTDKEIIVDSPINDLASPGYGIGRYFAPGESPWSLDWMTDVVQALNNQEENKKEQRRQTWQQYKSRFGELLSWYEHNKNELKGQEQFQLYQFLNAWIEAELPTDGKWFEASTVDSVIAELENHPKVIQLLSGAVTLPRAQSVAILRNPHLCQGEDAIVMPLDDTRWDLYNKRYGHLDGVVFAPNVVMGALNGADNDGDRVQLVSDFRVLNAIARTNKKNREAIWNVLLKKKTLIKALEEKATELKNQYQSATKRKDQEKKKALFDFYVRMKRLLLKLPNLPKDAKLEDYIQDGATILPQFGGSGQVAVTLRKEDNLRDAMLETFRLTGKQMIGVQSLNALDYASSAYCDDAVGDLPAAKENLTLDERKALHGFYGIALVCATSLNNALQIDMAKTGIRGVPSALMVPTSADDTIGIRIGGQKKWSGYRAFHHAQKELIRGMGYKERSSFRRPTVKSIGDVLDTLLRDQVKFTRENYSGSFALDSFPEEVKSVWDAMRPDVLNVIGGDSDNLPRLVSFFVDPAGKAEVTGISFSDKEPRKSKTDDLWIMSSDDASQGNNDVIKRYDGTTWQKMTLSEMNHLLEDTIKLMENLIKDDASGTTADETQNNLNIAIRQAKELLENLKSIVDNQKKTRRSAGLTVQVSQKLIMVGCVGHNLCVAVQPQGFTISSRHNSKYTVVMQAQHTITDENGKPQQVCQVIQKNEQQIKKQAERYTIRATIDLYQKQLRTNGDRERNITKHRTRFSQCLRYFLKQYPYSEATWRMDAFIPDSTEASDHSTALYKLIKASDTKSVLKKLNVMLCGADDNNKAERKTMESRLAQYFHATKEVRQLLLQDWVKAAGGELCIPVDDIIRDVFDKYSRKYGDKPQNVIPDPELEKQYDGLMKEIQSGKDQQTKQAAFLNMLKIKIKILDHEHRIPEREDQVIEAQANQISEEIKKRLDDCRYMLDTLVDLPQGVLLLKQLLHFEELDRLMRQVEKPDMKTPRTVNALYDQLKEDQELLYEVTYHMLLRGSISDFLFIQLNREVLIKKLITTNPDPKGQYPDQKANQKPDQE